MSIIRPSESPLYRLGEARPELRPRVREVPLIARQTIYLASHRALGEWRRWRELALLSGIDDPFDLEGGAHTGPLAQVLPEGDDLTDDLGVSPIVLYATGELRGTGVLVVEDVALGEYTLAWRAPAEDAPGAPVSVTDAALDAALDEGARLRVELVSGVYRLVLTIDWDAWLVLWLAREMPILFAPVGARVNLLAPIGQS